MVQRKEGLYCPPGDFYIDPWQPVERAVITHAHGDHARRGHARYLAAAPAEGVLRTRLGEVDLQVLPYGAVVDHFGVRLSFHPAGHVLGSAQVRLEHGGRVWVAAGDYYVAGASADAREDNATCAPFEPVHCHCFITESTFGLPIYRWQPQAALFAAIDEWWRANAEAGRASLLMLCPWHCAQVRSNCLWPSAISSAENLACASVTCASSAAAATAAARASVIATRRSRPSRLPGPSPSARRREAPTRRRHPRRSRRTACRPFPR